MFPSVYTDTYKKPLSCKPPTGAELMENTEFPNLNSLEYRQTPHDRTLKIHNVWEGIALNSNKHIVIGTNKCYGREWCSTLWGFEDIHKINEKHSCFSLQVTALLTQISYLSNNMLLATFRNGAVQLWSTYTQVRNAKQPYCLFLIGKKYEHDGCIECLEILEPKTHKAITGGQDLTLKIWDWCEADLQTSHTYRFAHLGPIKGISHSKADDCIFATCSSDKTVLIWDLRMVRPASALYNDHDCTFQDITWNDSNVNDANNLLFVGDSRGYVHTIDKRSVKKFVSSEKLFDRSLRKILSNGVNLAAIANTNIVKVYSTLEKKTIYENDTHMHILRDCIWFDSSKLLTVGCDSKLRTHDINGSSQN